jgi:hypothetical protein
VAFAWGSSKNQCWPFVGLSALGGVMNDPTGTTTCFGFLGFFASLFPRTWPLAMGILLATTSEIRLGLQEQTQHKMIIDRYARMRSFIFRPDRERTTRLTVVRIAAFL